MAFVSARMLALAVSSCVIGLGTLGCAATPVNGAPAAAPTMSAPQLSMAKRLYTAGERQFAEGKAAEAVALWRQAILQVPESPQYDDVRHRLILRRAYGQLVAHAQTGDRAYLDDGERMLMRYLEHHAGLFGDEADAVKQRGDVYEILFEFDTRLEALPPAESPRVAAAPQEPPAERDPAASLATAGIYDQTRMTRAGGIAATDQPLNAGARQLTPYGTSRPWREGDVRKVHVDTRGRPSVDDPATRAALRGWETEPVSWLMMPMVQEWIAPRPYVRVGGLARRVEGKATKLGGQGLATAVVRNVRPQLRSCYDAAFARVPAAVLETTVEFDVLPDGTVGRPSIVEGAVVDAIGDACVLDQLALARVPADRERAATRVRVPLTFFYDGAVYYDESNGRGISSTIQTGMPPTQSIPPSTQGCAMTGQCADPVPTRRR
jgi:hypothetical protein